MDFYKKQGNDGEVTTDAAEIEENRARVLSLMEKLAK